MKKNKTNKENNIQIAIKVFLILGCVSCLFAVILLAINFLVFNNINNETDETAFKIPIAFCVLGLLPLIWQIPMTIIYFLKAKNNEDISIAFKICILLFVSPVAGILMLCGSHE